MKRIAVLDDYQGTVLSLPYWSRLAGRAAVDVFRDTETGHVDVAAASARSVLVTETGGSGVAATEHTIGLMLATVRRIPQEDRAMREGRWQTGIGVELSGKTLGILGLGRIGFRRNFPSGSLWRGKPYGTKQVEVYAVREGSDWLVITVIARFF